MNISIPAGANDTIDDGFVMQFNHTMIRVKDPKASIKFYTEVCLVMPMQTHHVLSLKCAAVKDPWNGPSGR